VKLATLPCLVEIASTLVSRVGGENVRAQRTMVVVAQASDGQQLVWALSQF
jgi:hypothetical protein